MAVTIQWSTGIISVPRADLTLAQTTPTEIRNMDINWFRLALKDLEDDENGIPFPRTHNHNTEVSLGGVTYARVVEIIDPYTITFEDGMYAVNLVGANSNIGDKVNANQVSVRSANSAGLISSPEIQFATFENKVTVDVGSGFSGTVFPTGTPLRPVNNLDDAILIASFRGLNQIHTLSPLTIESGHNLEGMVVSSNNWIAVTIDPGALIDNTNFKKVSLTGTMSGLWNVLDDCWSLNITNFCGWARDGSIVDVTMADYTVANTGLSFFDDLKPFLPNVPSVITMAQDTGISMTGCTDIVRLMGLETGSLANVGLIGGGSLTVDASCTGGEVHAGGVGVLVNESLLAVEADGLVNPERIWAEDLSGTLTAGTAGYMLKVVQQVLRNKQITDPATGVMTVYDDDGTTVLFTANLKQDAAGTTPYAGEGAERRERLA